MQQSLRTHRRAVVPAILASCLLLAGCGGQDPAADPASPGETDGATDEAPTAAETPDLSGEPPAELVVEKLAPPADATAPQAAAGDTVAVHYTGRAWSTGEVFDSSQGKPPFQFTIGAGQVIAGWDQGIAGLQVGERARLIVPPDLGYGEAGAGGVIAPGETLVFDVEVVEILSDDTATEG